MGLTKADGGVTIFARFKSVRSCNADAEKEHGPAMGGVGQPAARARPEHAETGCFSACSACSRVFRVFRVFRCALRRDCQRAKIVIYS